MGFDFARRMKDSGFFQLQYPEYFIHLEKSKAIKIHQHVSYNKNNESNSNIYPVKRHIILPQNLTTSHIEKKLNHLSVKTVTCTFQTIKQLLKNN